MSTCTTCKFTPQKEGGSLTCQRFPTPIRVARSYFCGEYIQDGEDNGKHNKKHADKRVLRNQSTERVGSQTVTPVSGPLLGIDD